MQATHHVSQILCSRQPGAQCMLVLTPSMYASADTLHHQTDHQAEQCQAGQQPLLGQMTHSYAPMGIAAKSKGPQRLPISLNTGQ
jgi:hypothetical protein